MNLRADSAIASGSDPPIFGGTQSSQEIKKIIKTSSAKTVSSYLMCSYRSPLVDQHKKSNLKLNAAVVNSVDDVIGGTFAIGGNVPQSPSTDTDFWWGQKD